MVPSCIRGLPLLLMFTLLVFINNFWGRTNMFKSNTQRSNNGLEGNAYGKNYIFRPFRYINVK